MSNKNPTEISDEEVIKKVISGEPDYFRIIINRFSGVVLDTVSRHVPEDICEDMCQEVFVKAFKSLEQLDNADKLKGWLKRISVNCCCDYWRREYRRNEVNESSLNDFNDNILEQYGTKSSIDEFVRHDKQRHLRMILEKALMFLSPEDRIIMEMVYFDEISVAETAELMGMTRAGVKIRSFRAKRKLADILGKMGIKDSFYE
jgi:RNA polymerase sigma-70 factor (ECF subfamily)